jgi:hypothetical protein
MVVAELDATLNAVARPVASMVAVLVSDEVHVTEFVMSGVLPSCRWPVAVYFCVAPDLTLVLDGLITMDCSPET